MDILGDAAAPITRRVVGLAVSRTKEEPVILLEGPRSTGKSTAIRALAAEFGVRMLDFDDTAIREGALRDPELFTQPEKEAVPVLIDEYQRVPAILDSIKARMNVSSRPGQFILTGSTRHDALAGSVQALTGRIHRMRIFPFAQSEIERKSPGIIPKILADPEGCIQKEKSRAAEESRAGYIERIVKGGFPLALNRSPQARNRWFDGYVRQTVERDIPGIARIRNKRGLSALLRRLASQTAQILTIESAAAAASIDLATAREYIQLLQDVFMVYDIPAWGRTLKSRVAAKPKIHIADSGIATRLLGLTAEKIAAKEPAALTEFGHLLETFTVGEILKEISWLDDTVLTGHWHTHDGDEVDFIIELLDGSVYGFEIKASGRAPADTFSGLASLRKFSGAAFRAGFVFYTGKSAFKFDDRLFALPVAKLWE